MALFITDCRFALLAANHLHSFLSLPVTRVSAKQTALRFGLNLPSYDSHDSLIGPFAIRPRTISQLSPVGTPCLLPGHHIYQSHETLTNQEPVEGAENAYHTVPSQPCMNPSHFDGAGTTEYTPQKFLVRCHSARLSPPVASK
ncbi:hypothetical protein PAXRUDRAFT_823864 [Paxillus rubicundulus Ve08.2h10]|uniref:Unplaced genomic scaffold scaffold_70, whole genome shotgun sequence n=1 Tax=Paxillus rubicundulus Ve08.2h10 TaxID=930991 RepID=A0A0D0E312_9AGAM|nr:hypothetical protein PAXRUDRAFT_823864 [Paxillus rubicundulus Ve08.2h10]